ncbi:glycosyltransferase [Microbacterium sp. OR16]|uniref:glycosyltransferase n=1 Tax=Microbacterium sp. OR16 TaxID=3095345 RepID=UPI0039B457D4
MTDLASLSVIVVNYGSSALLEQNLVATAAALPGAEVIVVDNRTTAQEADLVTALAEREGWRALLQAENLGFGAGVNAGVEAARAGGRTRHLLLNPDARIDASSVSLLLNAVVGDAPAIAAPTVLDGAGRVWSAGSALDLSDGSTHGAAWIARNPHAPMRRWLTAAVLMVNEAAWARTRGFDEDYFLYWEDVDFSLRVEDAGGALRLVAEATAVHDEGGTHGGGDASEPAKSPTYYYFNIRNRMLLAAKLLDADAVRRWDACATAAAWQILLRGGRRQLMRPWRAIPPAWRGRRDGRRIARAQRSS